ncbi:hypothetical protein RAMDARK_0758 [Rickettsia amblyommatis str. Darkwater]|nr:hypothetical protein RAMDARK_0758 [Rickettsia amblyommatis str. Darkwater]
MWYKKAFRSTTERGKTSLRAVVDCVAISSNILRLLRQITS